MKISENTAIGLELKGLVSIVGAVAIAVWAYFGIISSINKLQTADQLMENDLLKKADQVPVDKEQFFLLESLATTIEKHQKQLDETVHTNVMLKMFEEEINKLKKDVEKLKDAQRDIKFSNGNGH